MSDRKKYILVIVDGSTDKTTLGWHLVNILSDEIHSVIVTYYHNSPKYEKNERGGDITGADVNRHGKIEKASIDVVCKKIAEIIGDINEKDGLLLEDYVRIIHIIDTDGRFINEKHIKEERGHSGGPIYSQSGIVTKNAKKTAENIKYKKETLRQLLKCKNLKINFKGTTKELPYEAYFMSCNLEHVIHNVQNANTISGDPLSKGYLANEAKHRYFRNTDALVQDLHENNLCLGDSYEKSWGDIKKGLRSLDRNTNIHLILENKD